jgi:hypothetical protein
MMDIRQALQKVRDTRDSAKGALGEVAGTLVGLPVGTLVAYYNIVAGKSWSEVSDSFSATVNKSGDLGRRYAADTIYEALKEAGRYMIEANREEKKD